MSSESALPLIDFAPFLHGAPEARRNVARAIDAALSSVGFFYLINHGISQNEVDECFHWVSTLSSGCGFVFYKSLMILKEGL